MKTTISLPAYSRARPHAARMVDSLFLTDRFSLLVSLTINLTCGIALAAVTGYVTVMLSWSAFHTTHGLTSDKTAEASNIYVGWGFLFVVGLFLVAIAVFGIHHARKVTLDMLLRYFWSAALGIAPVLLVSVSALDFYDVSKGWIRHNWSLPALEGVRKVFCDAGWEAGGQCAAPIMGHPHFDTALAWCQHYHNSTLCDGLQQEAQGQAYRWIHIMLITTGSVGVLNIFFLLVSMWFCVKMVTPSVVMTYANENMSYLLLLPAVGCAGIALYLFSHKNFSLYHTWMASLFIVSAILTFVNSLLSYLGGRYKKRQLLQAYMVINGLVILLLAALCSSGYILATSMVSESDLTDRRTQDIACTANLIGCCCCDLPTGSERCPEWTRLEVLMILASDFRIASLCALLGIIYEVGGLFAGFLLQDNLKAYRGWLLWLLGMTSSGTSPSTSPGASYVRLDITGDMHEETPPSGSRPKTGSMLSSKSIRQLSVIVFDMSGTLWVFPVGLLLTAILYEVAANRIMTVISGFYESITSHNTAQFFTVLWRSSIIVTVVAFLKALKKFCEESCALQFRVLLVRRLHKRYFDRDCVAYRLLCGDETGELLDKAALGRSPSSNRAGRVGVIDNPDQRCTSDVELFATTLATILGLIIATPGIIVYYTWFLWRLFGWTAPVACYAYFVIGVVINSLWLRRLVQLVYQQERLEGSFRFLHASFRGHIEAIAFYRGVGVEQQRADSRFDKVLTNRRAIIRRHLPLYLFTYFFDYIGSIVNYAAVGASILWLTYSNKASSSEIAGLVAQGSFSCLYLINGFSTILDTYEALSDLAGYASRLSEFLTALEADASHSHGVSSGRSVRQEDGSKGGGPDNMACFEPRSGTVLSRGCANREGVRQRARAGDATSTGPQASRTKGGLHPGAEPLDGWQQEESGSQSSTAVGRAEVLLSVEGLTLRLSDGRWLFHNVSFQVVKGQSLLVRGPSGVGKSSLFRALAGLWTHHALPSGAIRWAKDIRVMFVPQDTYCFNGSLLEQVTYPIAPDLERHRDAATHALNDVGLGHLVREEGGLSKVDEWSKRLSKGEAQRIALSRVLFHEPQLAVLDESTSALDLPTEAKVLEAIQQRRITLLSAGHRVSLESFHQCTVQLPEAGFE